MPDREQFLCTNWIAVAVDLVFSNCCIFNCFDWAYMSSRLLLPQTYETKFPESW
ncbi:hypothetical protein RchiOBHm_Chr5g0082661 [Rosa chinensis]|uniref:Uncharacterized protein n=1 Tax=Rosa chinensis TaxID=74649 RepID=A0A2P6QNC9_ROSCH|nr:hypothetical protein RchiOBHm_Chr5g0082661 [Rosa chinensis]